MARGLNKALIIGNLGKDPELKHTAGGHAVCTFSVATNETWTKDGETVERTEWHNVVAWRKLAEICAQYLQKGSKVYIEGKIQTRSWDDEKTGQKRYMTEIVADQLIMLGEKGERSAAPVGGGPPAHSYDSEPDPDYDDSDDMGLPF